MGDCVVVGSIRFYGSGLLLFLIPTTFDKFLIEFCFRVFGYPANPFSFSYPTFPNLISFSYSNVKLKTLMVLSRLSLTALPYTYAYIMYAGW
jgi:hypothetical protein